jgi:iron complex outermembrane receptor protein
LTLAITLSLPVLAQDDEGVAAERDHERELQEIVVTATPLAEPGAELVQPAAVISGADLERQRSDTIGETVSAEAGVQSSGFGPAVGRPVIRGLEGARVQVLSGGVGSLDVSTVSADHAVTIEPFLADQIEVLKGPATLLYGSGAIGGVVNVVDGRIAEQPQDGLSGRAELHGGTANDEFAGMARVDYGSGPFVLHADYVSRDGDDYDLPDGTLLNSAIDQESYALGASLAGDAGYFGAAVSRYLNLYGVPLGSSEDDLEPGEERVAIDMEQTRTEVRAGLYSPTGWLDKLGFKLARNDYEHVEIADGEIGTRFENDAYEGRIEAVHAEAAGWTGAFGVQFGNREFQAIGEEAFVPPTETDELGLFLIEQREIGPFKLELGARYDDVGNETTTGLDADHSPVALSAGAIWEFDEAWHLSMNLDRAQRAPAAEELFSNGPHEATASFEIGDPTLDEETANQAELGLHFHSGSIEGEISVYANRFDDFIFLADTGAVDDDEGLPVRAWTQADADFRGIEGELKATVAENASGRWDARVFGDLVDGELDDGGSLPRIAPARLGGSLGWELDAWRASAGVTHVFEQDDVAAFETPTAGYTLVDAHVSYALDLVGAEWELFLDGTNLTDEDATVHNSLIKERAPLPGRSFQFGARVFF